MRSFILSPDLRSKNSKKINKQRNKKQYIYLYINKNVSKSGCVILLSQGQLGG